ncbi:uncharacterized protein PHALS_11576 [Plasmopara halstedii]|uniref:Uncharacterized protein n=1 Tax=Plasmopara halstedii TaxID=4781 RepID=A0A0P1AJ06_PLAHL|nr:uncharacterized protein PHALS_11576 [Plasmopara halstedii]CEG41214.1 hypothetical protein PHALS_11576 [Plasmopara halstedii]|eukprot:XP_024577583.1 hypothetical protein PHALS_11576 [Plasmopara halstedii]
MIRNNKETNWRLRMLFQDSDELARAAIATTSSVAITIREYASFELRSAAKILVANRRTISLTIIYGTPSPNPL